MNMLKQLGFFIALFPVAFLQSMETVAISALLFGISVLANRKLIILDVGLILLAVVMVVSYFNTDAFGHSFIVSQVGSHVVFLFSLRFFYVCREDFIPFVVRMGPWTYGLLALIYIAAQIKIGYTYEVGTLEGYLLVRLAISKRQRSMMAFMLVVYFFIMFVISTRATPFVCGMIVALAYFVAVPKRVLQAFYTAVIALTPLYGFIMYHFNVEKHVADTAANAAIRLEMIKGATSMIGVKQFFFGMGVGTPFRDPNYNYSFPHPLLNDVEAVMIVSNHNSVFDVFLRFGLVGYLVFAVVFMRVLKVGNIVGTRGYAVLFIALYNLSINAFLDSTRLSHVTGLLVAGIFFACERIRLADPQVQYNSLALPGRVNG